jgi:hypothetical protein
MTYVRDSLEAHQRSPDWFGDVLEVFILIKLKYRICMQYISHLHTLYQCQLVLGILTTATDLVGI